MAARRAHPRNTSLLDSRLQRSSGTHGVHWGISGEPNGYGSRTLGAFLLPVVVLGMWGLLIALPRLHPRSENIEKFRDTYDVFVVAVIAVMCVLHVAVVGSALGWPVPVSRLAPVAIGALFTFLGTLLPRFSSNFFFGIRTPWTLSSDTAWARTQRVGGYLMVLTGLLLMLAGFLGSPLWLWIAIGGAVALAAVVLVYSYVVWRAEQRAHQAISTGQPSLER